MCSQTKLNHKRIRVNFPWSTYYLQRGYIDIHCVIKYKK